jgi:hypothetical protein
MSNKVRRKMHTISRFLILFDHVSKLAIPVINSLSHRQHIIFELNIIRTLTVTTAKIYSAFTDEITSTSTDTPHSQTVQGRHSVTLGHDRTSRASGFCALSTR